eukprot:1895250-Prymnesium_polylepis.1
MAVARTERCRVAVDRSAQPGKYVTSQPVDSVSIDGSISSEMSSTFGSAPPHGALLASRSSTAGSASG